MACKITWFYQQGARGWTEVFYSGGSDPVSVYNGLSTALYAALVNCRAYGTGLTATRVSTTDVFPKKTFTRYHGSQFFRSPPSGTAAFGVLGDTPDVASTCALFTLEAGGITSRPLYLRGLLDSSTILDFAGGSVPPPALNTAIKALSTQLTSNGLCARQTVRPPGGTLSWWPILFVQPNSLNPLWTDLTMAMQSPFPVPYLNSLSFEGIKRNDLPGFPKQAQCVKINGTNTIATIPYRYRATGATYTPQTNARACLLQYNYQPITNVIFRYFGERKTGRPFGEPRGRARKVITAL